MPKVGRFAGWLLLSCCTAGGCVSEALRSQPEPLLTDPIALATAERSSSGRQPAPAVPESTDQAQLPELAEIRQLAKRNQLPSGKVEQLVKAVQTAAPQHRRLLAQTILAQLAQQTKPSGSAPQNPEAAEGEAEPSEGPASSTPSGATDQPARDAGSAEQAVTADSGESGRQASEAAAKPSSTTEMPSQSGAAEDRPADAVSAADVKPDHRPTPQEGAPSSERTGGSQAAESASEQRPSPPQDASSTNSSQPETATSDPPLRRPAATISVDSLPASPQKQRQAVRRSVADEASSGDVEVAAAGTAEQDNGSWRQSIRQAITALRRQLQDEQLDQLQRARLQTQLALLHVAAEQHELAVESLQDFRNEQELEFWRQQMLAMGILLDAEELPKIKYRVESASECLRKGTQALCTLGPLTLKNLALCTKVSGFGDFTEFESYAFRPGQQVLLYVEVENYTVEQVEVSDASASSTIRTLGGSSRLPVYETELQGRYEIFDSAQRPVTSRLLPLDRNRCRNHRRDYFIPYMLYLPDEISAGSYTLELVLEDKKGGKFGSGMIEFRIK